VHRPQTYFISGTDTEVGKTFVTRALLHAARRQGMATLAMKPVAAGVGADGRNEDVEQLIAASSVKAARDLVNPYCFGAAIAPHIAAAAERRTIEADLIVAAFRQLAKQTDLLLVEGVGGFRVPLGDDFDTADLAVHLGLPVILVVGLRLGCLNHALLTAEAIAVRGLPLAGWIANRIEPDMPRWQDNIAALRQRLAAPLLGVLPWLGGPGGADSVAAASHLRLPWEQPPGIAD
jgi:dethiobiotin synthetase